MNLGEKISTLRKRRGYSQERLAEELGVTRQSIYKWESNQAKPEIDKIQTLTLLFDISFDNLLDDAYEIKEEKIDIFVEDTSRVPQIHTKETMLGDSLQLHQKFVSGVDIYRKAKRVGPLKGLLTILSFIFVPFAIILLVAHFVGGANSTDELGQFAYTISVIAVLLLGLRIFAGMRTKKMFAEGAEKMATKRKEIMDFYIAKGFSIIETLPTLCFFFFIDKKNEKFGTILYDKIAFECPFESFLKYEIRTGGNTHQGYTKAILAASVGSVVAGASGAVIGGLLAMPSSTNSPSIYQINILTKGINSDVYHMTFFSYFVGLQGNLKKSMMLNQRINYYTVNKIVEILNQIKG